MYGNLLNNECDFIDIWRLNNGNKKDYTWSGYTPLIARRLDYILVSRFFLPYLTDCYIASIGHSDHRIVICNIEFNKFERGKGTYKMNSSLFDNFNFRTSVKNLIHNSNEELNDLDPILKWEAIKIRVKELSQSFGRYNTFKNKEENKLLENKLLLLENELAGDPSNLEKQKEVHHINTKLEIKNLETAKAAKIRSKIQWIEEGEKCSKFFLSLEKHRSISNTVFKITDNYGHIKNKGPDIVEVFADHFSKVMKTI